MWAALQESMRLQPVAATPLTRVAVRDLRLSDGTLVPAGTVVETAQYTPMRDARWGWKDGDSFLPVRGPPPSPQSVRQREGASASI